MQDTTGEGQDFAWAFGEGSTFTFPPGVGGIGLAKRALHESAGVENADEDLKPFRSMLLKTFASRQSVIRGIGGPQPGTRTYRLPGMMTSSLVFRPRVPLQGLGKLRTLRSASHVVGASIAL